MNLHKASQSIVIISVLLLVSQFLQACGPRITDIAELKSRGDIEKLIKALDYKHENYKREEEIHTEAIEALSELGNPAVEKLLETYHSRKPEKRKNIGLALREISNQAVTEFAQEALGVCSGNAMPGAGKYDPNSLEPKPLLYVNTTGDIYYEGTVFKSLNLLPVDWLPYKRSDLQAVVCMQVDRTLLETCSFSGGVSYSISRWKATIDVNVREAATGNIIGNFAFDGDDPQPCPDSVTVSKPGTSDYDSDDKLIIASIVENLAKLGFVIKN